MHTDIIIDQSSVAGLPGDIKDQLFSKIGCQLGSFNIQR